MRESITKIVHNLFRENYSLEELRFFVACLFAFTLPFDRGFSQLLLILLLVLVLMDLNIKKLKSIPKTFWVFQIFFLLSVAGMIYSHLIYANKTAFEGGSSLIERQLAILIFPLLLPLSFKLTEKRINKILLSLTLACLISLSYLFISNFLIFLSLGISITKYLQSGLGLNQFFTEPLHIHASYYSAFICLALFFVLKEYRRTKKIFWLAISIFFGLGLLFLTARSIIIALIVVLLFVYPFFYIKKLKRFFFVLFILAIPLVVIVSSSSYLNYRFGIAALTDIGIQKGKVESEPRITRWNAAVDIILEAPIIGHGTGSEVHELKKKYWERGLIYSYFKEYNSHNQFLSIAIKHGLIGLLFVLGSFFFFFKLAIQNKSFLYLSFLILILSFCMVENVMDANKGIFFFAFFNPLFGYYYLSKKTE